MDEEYTAKANTGVSPLRFATVEMTCVFGLIGREDVVLVIRAKRGFPSGMTNKKGATSVPLRE